MIFALASWFCLEQLVLLSNRLEFACLLLVYSIDSECSLCVLCVCLCDFCNLCTGLKEIPKINPSSLHTDSLQSSIVNWRPCKRLVIYGKLDDVVCGALMQIMSQIKL